MKEYYMVELYEFFCVVDIVTFSPCEFYTDQKPLDLAHGAEMKHILVGNKVCIGQFIQ